MMDYLWSNRLKWIVRTQSNYFTSSYKKDLKKIDNRRTQWPIDNCQQMAGVGKELPLARHGHYRCGPKQKSSNASDVLYGVMVTLSVHITALSSCTYIVKARVMRGLIT